MHLLTQSPQQSSEEGTHPYTDGNQVLERLTNFKFMQLSSGRHLVHTKFLLRHQITFLSTHLQVCCVVVTSLTPATPPPPEYSTYIAEYESNIGC